MKKGFTLTELLIVVSIIAFLTVLVVGFLRSQVLKGNDAKRKADINKIGIALEEYENDNNCYPLPNLVVCDPGIGLRPYLDKIPCDSVSKTSYYYETDGNLTCPRWYRLYARLENDKDNDYLAGIGQGGLYSYYQSSPNAPALDLGEGEITGYGCFGGECQPLYSQDCFVEFIVDYCNNQCGPPANECNQ